MRSINEIILLHTFVKIKGIRFLGINFLKDLHIIRPNHEYNFFKNDLETSLLWLDSHFVSGIPIALQNRWKTWTARGTSNPQILRDGAIGARVHLTGEFTRCPTKAYISVGTVTG